MAFFDPPNPEQKTEKPEGMSQATWEYLTRSPEEIARDLSQSPPRPDDTKFWLQPGWRERAARKSTGGV